MKTFQQYLVEISQPAIEQAVKRFVKGGATEAEARDYITRFDDIKSQEFKKGIDLFKLSFEQLKALVEDGEKVKTGDERRTEKRTKKLAEKKVIPKNGADIVWQNEKAIIYKPKSYEGSVALTYLDPVQAEELKTLKAHWCTGAESERGRISWSDVEDWKRMVTFWIVVLKDGTDRWGVQVNIDHSQFWWDVMNHKHTDEAYIGKIMRENEIPKNMFTEESARLQAGLPNQRAMADEQHRIIMGRDYTDEEYEEMRADYGDNMVSKVKQMKGLLDEPADEEEEREEA